MHWRRRGACERFSDSQLISSLIFLGTGGVVSSARTSMRERSEAWGKKKKLSSLASPLVIVIVIVIVIVEVEVAR